MDYRLHLLQPLSVRFVDQLVIEIFKTPADFPKVYKLIFDKEIKVAWRAAWACQKISEKQQGWFSEELFLEIKTLTLSTSHGGLHRGCLSILNNLPLPDPIPVDLINSCFEWMISPRYPIAVQALSMKLLYKICIQEPDFIPELIACLENLDPTCYSAGFISTRKNILKKLTCRNLPHRHQK